jgi:hypothetical protein
VSVELTGYRGWEAVVLHDDHLRVVAIPALGGKLVSLRAGDTEWLWQDPSRPLRTPEFGGDFGDYDISGWDECFPTVGPCAYPDAPWAGIDVADHGELWCQPWRYQIVDGATLHMHASGVRFGYRFERTITLEGGGRLRLRYRVENLTPFPFKALWSAHPLFAAEQGMRVHIPGSPLMRVAHAIGGRIAGDIRDELRWPLARNAEGAVIDYSIIDRPDIETNDKVFVDAPAEGWCALLRPRTGESLRLSFAPADVPGVGVCINHGGYPPTGERTFWVAIEPCWGWPDRLDQATAMGVHATLEGWATREWELGVSTTDHRPPTIGKR